MKSAFLCLVAWVVVHAYPATGQDAPSAQPTKSEVVFLALAAPKYPPLARQANITGEVQIKLRIGKDGSVASADVMGGPPMLTPAALTARSSPISNAGDVQMTQLNTLLSTPFRLQKAPAGRPQKAAAHRVFRKWETV